MRLDHAASQSCASGHSRWQLRCSTATRNDSDVVQQFGVYQRNVCCAAHADGGARSSIQTTPGLRCQYGIPQNCGRKGRWRQPRKFDKSTNGPGLRNLFIRRRLGPRHGQPRPLLCCSQLSEEHHPQPMCQTSCYAEVAPSAAWVSVSRARTKLSPRESAAVGPPPKTRDRGSGKNKKQRTVQDKSPLLNSASEESTASLATTEFSHHSLSPCAWPAQFRKQWRVQSQQRRAHLSVGHMASGLAAIADPNHHNAPRIALLSSSEAVPLSVICSVARHLLDGWDQCEGSFVAVCSRRPHSSLIAGVRQSLERFSACPLSATVNVNVPVERDNQGNYTRMGSAGETPMWSGEDWKRWCYVLRSRGPCAARRHSQLSFFFIWVCPGDACFRFHVAPMGWASAHEGSNTFIAVFSPLPCPVYGDSHWLMPSNGSSTTLVESSRCLHVGGLRAVLQLHKTCTKVVTLPTPSGRNRLVM